MTKHTPGPWRCVDTSYHAHDYRLLRPDGLPLPVKAEANDHSEQRANARLIAASPELLEALKEIAADLECMLTDKQLTTARAAIRKAEEGA